MSARKVHRITSAIGAMLIAGCATAPGQPGNDLMGRVRETFASDDPCSNNARNIGMVGGAVLGVVIGNSVGNGKSNAKLAGAVLGGVVGSLIGSDIDRRRCELSKIAKQFDLNITVTEINAATDVTDGDEAGPSTATTVAETSAAPTASPNGTTVAAPQATSGSSNAGTALGSSVTVRDKDGTAGHFEPGSDKLTPKAREYFAAIGAQYNANAMAAAQTDPKRKDALMKQLSTRRIFLIGHTDDTGSSELNASLSERRARAVAGYLKQQGVAEESLYFQGAGESLPTADNRTEDGRAANRRVEIVEVTDELAFKKYLETRKPNYQFYRAVESMTAAASSAQAVKPSPEPTPKASSKSTTAANQRVTATTASKPAANNAAAPRNPVAGVVAVKRAVLDFGGAPYSVQAASLNIGTLVPEKTVFSFIPKAYAADSVITADCSIDRPRAVGEVKSLGNSATYKTNEYMPQLYGKTWSANVNGNEVRVNRLAVLRDGGKPANLPQLKVYLPSNLENPEISEEPKVNSYVVSQGILYRMFPSGAGGLQCMDLLLATDGSSKTKDGRLIYARDAAHFVATVNFQVQP